ncbi:MAG: NAD(P)-dependent oxidoreductase [Rhodoblastus sp.]
MMRILLTGASGGVGSRLRPLLRARYRDLVLSDLAPPADLHPDETFIPADLADPAAVARAVEGVHGIVHLGGFAVEGPWETILSANIVGCYNLFEQARHAGVRRIVFASSNHVMGFYPRTQTVGVDNHVLPDSRYGVSKAFGEALGAMYAHKHGIGVTCIRIGNVDDVPVDERRLAIWMRPDDLFQLVRIGLERDNLVYEIVYGMSDNSRAWWDNARARQLGYAPRGRSEDHVMSALDAQKRIPADPVADVFQGGAFCSAEFSKRSDREG